MTDDITRNEQITVGTTSVRVADERKRKVLYVKNTSTGTQAITVVFGRFTAEENKGVVLDLGEIIVDSDSEEYTCFEGVITAISSAADGKLSIYER